MTKGVKRRQQKIVDSSRSRLTSNIITNRYNVKVQRNKKKVKKAQKISNYSKTSRVFLFFLIFRGKWKENFFKKCQIIIKIFLLNLQRSKKKTEAKFSLLALS